MKFKSNPRYNTVAAYSLIVLLFTVLCVFFGFYFNNILGGLGFFLNALKPLIYGFIMAFMFSPMLRLFEDRLFAFTEKKKPHPQLRAGLALILTYFVVFAVITLFAIIIIPQAATSYTDLQIKLADYVSTAQSWIDNALRGIPAVDIVFSSNNPSVQVLKPVYVTTSDGSIPNIIISRISGSHNSEMFGIIHAALPEPTHYNVVDMINKLIENSYNFFSDLTPYIFSSVMNLVTETKNILIGLIISAYYLSARKSLTARLRLVMETFLPRKLNETLLSLVALVNQSFIQFVNGKIIDAAIIGVLCFIFMNIFHMPYAPLISLLVGVTNIIPYIGPFLGATPGAFIIFVSDPPMALWFILLIIALQQSDMYLIEPHVLQTQIKLDSVWILLSVIIMGGLFGIVGLFIGVPVFAVFYTLLKNRAEYMLEKKGLPTETSAWFAQTKDTGE
jgi:predicted PurR-regulated permease PerM